MKTYIYRLLKKEIYYRFQSVCGRTKPPFLARACQWERLGVVVELQPPEGVAGGQSKGTGQGRAGAAGSCSPAALPGGSASTCLFCERRRWLRAPLLPSGCCRAAAGWHPNQEPLEEAWETSEGKDLLGFSV